MDFWKKQMRLRVVARANVRFACMGLMLALGFANTASAQVSVGDGGTPSYSQAIPVPPGVAGMAPKLSLFYGGGGVNGPLGHGWSVQGLSSITRCAANVAVDGKRSGVTYSANDKLCLDGQRLIQTDANGTPLSFPQTNDAAGLAAGATREFRTEKEIYARVRAYGYANGDASGASGPAYFRVWTKAGQVYDYGASPTADTNTKALIAAPGKAPMAWAVARISDTLGNAIDFKYEQRDVAWGSGPTAGSPTVGHEWNILEIQYSSNKVVFNYDVDANGNDLRPDKAEAYQQGNKNVSLRRLKSITTYVNSPASALGANGGTAVKTTQLGYETGAISGRSRINKIQECAGGVTSTRCLPASTLQYANGGNEAYQASSGFSGSPLSTLDMLGTDGSIGVISGDFNGDGKTDILYWSDTPANNKVYLSNGDGSFSVSNSFNILDQNLFKSDGCYYSVAADFNGDGITDLLRITRATSTNGSNSSCGAVVNTLFIGNGDGGFSRVAIPSFIDFNQKQSITASDSRWGSQQSPGANYYLVDVDGDGYLDIVTTIIPGYSRTAQKTEQQQCAAIICTRVFRLKKDLTFAEVDQPNVIHRSLYADPKPKSFWWKSPYVGDVDGDGYSDLNVSTGLWISQGDGNFLNVASSTFSNGCANQIDANGDGRVDCVQTFSTASSQSINIGVGPVAGVRSANFNLVSAGQELYESYYVVNSSSYVQTAGIWVSDFNGDGRQDILRWKDDASQNLLYLSNGDGTFRTSTSFNLAGTQLKKSDGTSSLIGDFTGRGVTELLRLQTSNGVGVNVLYTKIDPTPADQLVSVTSGSGLKTTLYYVPLSNSTPSNGVSAGLGARYQSDLGNSAYAVAGAVDLTMPMYVVATSVSDSAVGTSRLATEMSYRGLKADLGGRGLLGFREVLRQRVGAEGSPLTVDTQYVQFHPYTGVASSTNTYQGALNAIGPANLLSSVTNVYCDQTNVAAASTSANCAVTAKVAKPYLYWSSESGKDLSGSALPTVTTTNTFNGNGDPTQISVVTSGTAANIAQTFTKITTNSYLPSDTSCTDEKTCVWITGRLTQASVTNTVPNSLDAIQRSAGNGAFASATAGTGNTPTATPQPRISPAVLNVILSILLSD